MSDSILELDLEIIIAARCPLPAARCPLPAARCPLPAARCPLPAARCSKLNGNLRSSVSPA
ncbi:hypothetical protein A8H27_17650 [Burkholderia cenocepacia]|nr:hypothetical protein A8H27_17650 [Burkholderia cenocepacia]